jgi:hypothetical protein
MSETISATIAAAASTAPTERSMPPVRITKVMPAASTVLIEACWATIDRLFHIMKRPSLQDRVPVSV